MNNNEMHTIATTARFLLPGDVLIGSGFTVTEKAFRSVRSPKGKVIVTGHYPGKPSGHYEWNGSTTITVKR